MAATKSAKGKSSKSGGRQSKSMSRGGGKRGGGGRPTRSPSSRGKAAQATTDHDLIRRWVEERGGSAACVKGTGGRGDQGVLRIDFPGYTGGDSLQHIDWDEWFEKFDDN